MPAVLKGKKRTISSDSDDSDDSDHLVPPQRGRAQETARSRRPVVPDDDDDDEDDDEADEVDGSDDEKEEIDSEGEGIDLDDEDEDEGGDEEEADEEVDSEEEEDMTIIEATLPAVQSQSNEKLVSHMKRKHSDSSDEMRAGNSPLATPKKSSSSEADSRLRDLPPQTPEQRSIPHSANFTASGPARPLMMPHTPRTNPITATPASQARSTAAPLTPAPPRVRLVIHKMVLRNFKSYAGEQIIGPFHKSFSAVVGPNGSGKSNVIDAMLFVFGWRANKMRQGKLSELIHNSAGKENIPSCSVEVWFREIVDLPGPDEFTVVPKSKLIVARTAYRNNSSVYTLNSKKSSFTEVTTLLKTRGIDLDHKRFLILQGEVESIAQMPPKAKNEHEEGLLEYLEDIIGTSSFKTPIEEASKSVDEANELRSERLARLKIVQKERDSLEPKKREAETYLRDQNELAQHQSSLWQIYMMECRNEMTIATTAMDKLKERMEEERQKHAGSKAEIDALEKQYKTVTAEFDAIAKETDKMVKALGKYEKEDVQLQEQRKHLETKKRKLIKSMNDDKHASSEARSTLSNSIEEIETMQKEVTKLETSLEKEEAELDRIRDSLKGKTEKFSRAIEEKQVELQPWVAKISEKKNSREVALEEKRLLTERSGQAAKEAEDAQRALVELKHSSESKAEELERLRQEKEQQVKKSRQYEEEIKSMEMQEQELRAKATTSRVKCEDAKASMQSNRSRGDILSTLSRQAELGMIKGFHGRLGNLGTIDDKYDVAISTACPGLDNIVVDGVEHGQACIEHLRKNNLGRANFILLNSLAKMNLSPIQTPEGVPRLFDLVKPRDARFAPAFYHQLRDTLVARDLAHANRIAYGAQRWRVVTLDGQLIDKSGTMSGGGTKVARGAMSSMPSAPDITLEQLSRLDRERQVNEEALQKQVKYTQEMRGLLEFSRSRLPQIEMMIEKIVMDVSNNERMIQEAQKRVKELQKQQDPDDTDAKRVKDLEGQVSGLDAEIDKLSQKSSTLEAAIAALQEKILEAGGVELRAQNSKVDGMKERIELFGERMTKAEVARTKAERDLVKLTKNTEKNTSTLEGLEGELQDVLEQIASKLEAVEAARKQVEETQFSMETKKEFKDEIKVKLDSLLESANTFRSMQMEIKQKLEDSEKSHHDNEKKLAHWQEKHEKLQLQEIDSDDEDETERQQEENAPPATEAGDDAAEKEKSNDMKPERAGRRDAVRLCEYSPDELRSFNKDSLKAEIADIEEKLQKGQGNLSVLQEFKKRDQEFLARAKDLEKTTQDRDEAKRRHDELRKQRLDSFMAGFSIISAKLKEMYQTITLGGNAELELVDSLDPFSEGILFSVMPPKKSWKNISNLSGGEKTLSSLALVFALHAFKPTPLYAMDELDAALDFRNVSIVANLIKERTKGAQFIVISLRNNMFELASRLVGIYKTNGQTKSLAVHNSDLHALPIAPPPPPSVSRATATPRPPSLPRGSVPPSMTTPSLHQPPSTLRKTVLGGAGGGSGLSSALASPAPRGFMQIPQTPRTGTIRGLGISNSSMKLTSSQSIRGDLAGKLSSSQSMFNVAGDRGTPLAVRRHN